MNPTQAVTLGLSRLLEIEDDTRILEWRCEKTGLPAWTFVRQPLLRLLGVHQLHAGAYLDFDYRLRNRGVDKATVLARSLLHNTRRHRLDANRGQIAIFASGSGNIRHGGAVFNRFADHFAQMFPTITVVCEDLFNWQWPQPRVNDRMFFHAPILAGAAIVGRGLAHRHHARAAEFINFVDSRAGAITGAPIAAKPRAWLTIALARWFASAPFLVAAYGRTFERLGTRILLKEEGCYGHAACIMAAARSRGIVTAEYQHGAVSRNHDAYNFSAAIRGSAEYACTLPDFFLSYGEWWDEQINVPVQRFPVGNPHRSETMVTREHRATPELLVLGEGVDSHLYRAFCLRLRAGLPSTWKVIFRPHPLERSLFAGSSLITSWNGIEIDRNRDIYTSFATATAVLSEGSTGLFEAVGMVDRILVWDTDKSRFAMPSHPFQKVKDSDEVISCLVRDDRPDDLNAFASRIWAPDWQARYHSFIKQALA